MDIREFLQLLQHVSGPNSSGEYTARCPCHDDKTASLTVTVKASPKDGRDRIYFHCHAGCSNDAIMARLGLKPVDLMLSRVADALPGLVKAVMPGAIRLVEGLGDAIAENAESFAELAAAVMTATGTALVTALPKIIEKLPEIFSGIWEGLSGQDWPGLGGDILGKVMEGLGGFGARVAEIFTGGRDEVAKVNWSEIGEKMKGVAAEFVNLTPDLLAGAFRGAHGIIKGLNWDALGETVGHMATGLIGIAGEVLAAPLQAAYGFLGELKWKEMGENIALVPNALTSVTKEALSGAFEAAYLAISEIPWDELGSDIADGLSRGWGLLAGVGDVALGLGESVVGAGQQGVGALKDWIASWRQDGSVETEATAVGAKVITDLAAGVTDSVPDLEITAGEAGDALLKAIQDKLTLETVKGIGLEFDKDIGTGIDEGTTDVLVIVEALAGDVYDSLASEVTRLGFDEIGRQVDAGIAEGISGNSWMLENAARSAARLAYEAARKELDINSPSGKGEYLGEMFDLGFAGGVVDNADEVKDAVGYLSDLATDNAQVDTGRFGAASAQQIIVLDYGQVKDAFVDAIEETGLGDMVMAVDGQIMGETLEPYSSRATRQRQQKSVKGRTARLVMG